MGRKQNRNSSKVVEAYSNFQDNLLWLTGKCERRWYTERNLRLYNVEVVSIIFTLSNYDITSGNLHEKPQKSNYINIIYNVTAEWELCSH